MPLGVMYATANENAIGAGGLSECMLRIQGASTHISVLHEFRISQSSQARDANTEILNLSIYLTLSAGSDGTSGNEIGLLPGSPASLSDVQFGGSFGVVSSLYLSEDWNNQAGFLYLPTPETRIAVPGVAGEDLEFVVSSPTAATTFHVSAVWEEILIT